MAVHRHNSWGRTRSPKNIAGDPGTAVTLEANTNNLRSSNAGYKLVGYATENQRYLHVLFTDLNATAPAATTVYGYCHAFERWFELPETEAGGEGQNTANAAVSVTAVDSTRATADQVPSDTEYRVYSILGIDRVAFVNSDSAETAVFAACSTF
jgi:hypothetical protein